MVELYKTKVKFTEEQTLFYPVIGANINKQRTLVIFSQFFYYKIHVNGKINKAHETK